MIEHCKTKAAFICLFTVLLLWIAGLLYFVNDAFNTQAVTAEKQLDAIVVLTGGSNRIEAGFDLLEKKAAKKLFISGVYRGVEAKALLKLWKSEPQTSLDCCVALGFDAYNTVQNARETIDWLRAEKFNSIYLVTSNYHIRRAMLEFKARDKNIEIHPYPIMPDNFSKETWWTDAKTRGIIVKEYSKYIASHLINLFVSF